MKKDRLKRKPKPYSVSYYIEEVVKYRSEYKAGKRFEDGYPPVVPELLTSILLGLQYVFRALCLTICLLFFFLAK